MTSDTPRTNAIQQGIDRRANLRGFVVPEDVFDMADLARQLEADLAAANALAEQNEKDAGRYRVLAGLFKLEIQRLLRAHLGIAGGSMDTLADAAIAAKEKP